MLRLAENASIPIMPCEAIRDSDEFTIKGKGFIIRKTMIACVLLCCFYVNDTFAWGNKAKAEAKAEKKAEKQKTGIKDWQMTRFKHMDVSSAISAKGKVEAEDVAVVCNMEEVQPLADALIAGYVTVVNILEKYVEVEEGCAVAGLVAQKVDNGRNASEIIQELSVGDKSALEKYLQWLKAGENGGNISIEDENLEKIMAVATSFKEQIGEIKERVKGRKGSKIALMKDTVTIAKIAGSTVKGGMILKGIIGREKNAKKLLLSK